MDAAVHVPCPHIWLHIDAARRRAQAYSGVVNRLIALFLTLLLSLGAAHAQAQQPARTYTPAEMDAMLAPIALYPDPLLTQILTASIYPFDVKAAADWSAANPNVTGDDALRAVEGELWHPSVKALVAYPDVLARMGESMQWVTDLGQAYQNQYPALSASIQGLRSRAQSTGALQSNEQQQVYQQNDAIYVQPVYPNVVYAPYYNPYVVYGGWWWPAIYPVVWRPWVARAVYVTRVVAPVRIAYPGHVWHPGYVHPVRSMPTPQHVVRQPVGQIRPFNSPMPTPRAVSPRVSSTPYHAVPESRRAPIVHSGPAVRSAPVMHTAPNPVARGNYVHAAPQARGSSAAGGSGGFRGGSHGGNYGGSHGGGGRRG